ncbi:MAG: hypothetical protein ACK5LC_06690, partial [Coprobacillaceae bacterium]
MRNIFTYPNLINNIEEIDSKKEQIIAFVFAPYHEKRVAEIVDQFYDYWNIKFDDSILHFFWLGYVLEVEQKPGRWLVDSHCYEKMYYDIKIFNDLVKQLNTKWKFTYKDKFEIVLVKCVNSKIDFKNTIRIDLEDCFTDIKEIKKVMCVVNDVVNEYKTFFALKQSIKNMKGLKRLRKID